MKKIIVFIAASIAFHCAFASDYADTLGFDKSSAWSPGQILTDHISGLRVESDHNVVGSDVKVFLRGINSFRSDSQPLWIIDGVMVDSDLSSLSWLNLEDIKSVSILKDLSTTAIYGAQGANGVILVSTYGHSSQKKYSDGDFDARWNSNAGINPRFSHNHSVAINGKAGKTAYSVSGFFRQNNGQSSANNEREGGARICFETSGSSLFQIGSTTNISFGKQNNNPSYDDERQTKGGGTALYVLCNINPSLNLKIDGGVDLRNRTEYVWYGNDTPEGIAGNGDASIFGTALVKYNAKAALNWHRYFAENHQLSATASFDLNSADTKYSSMSGTGFFTHSLKAKGITLADSTPDVSKYDHVHFSLGGYFTLGYNFKNIAGINAGLRLDRTPRYDDNARLSKSGNVYFDIRNAFFSDSKAISALRLTAGYGEAGREESVPYYLYPLYLPGSYPTAEAESEPFFEGLCRSRSAEFNTGIELGFISNRITIGAKYYDKRTLDSFYGYCFGQKAVLYWDYAPRTDVFSRTSLLSNRGFEFDLVSQIIRTKKVSWSIDANASWNVNQFLRVDSADASKAVLGRSAGTELGYVLDKNGVPVDVTGDGIVDKYDIVACGNTIPSVIGGLGTNLKAGHFCVDVLAGAAAGYYFRVDRVSVGYSLPVKENGFVKALRFRVNAFPSWKGVLAGVSLDL